MIQTGHEIDLTLKNRVDKLVESLDTDFAPCLDARKNFEEVEEVVAYLKESIFTPESRCKVPARK
jgi:hypothetical protein